LLNGLVKKVFENPRASDTAGVTRYLANTVGETGGAIFVKFYFKSVIMGKLHAFPWH
jgi:hypothetical protein